ncbi:hypothetical protein ABI59_02795 [Acidobacteria bacterium Mor1]|nr:hypothetical protein ABI59_02795 [Acidobacteria bacterium Mor1]
MSEISTHWADEVAEQVVATGRPVMLSTGISPSGEIHIGNMREVLTADAVYRALCDRGVDAGFNYVCDNFDPLRKVYPFLDEAVYAPRVGQPLSEIPAPRGEGSYSEYFLQPFLGSLARLKVDVHVERADQMYKSGRMNPFIVLALEGRDRIAAILHELTGKEMKPEWSPFNPLCPECGRIDRSQVLGFSAADETVDYRCACGAEGSVPMAGGGKLVWRIDWPARWAMLGVTVEPFGKDHATRGGSYDTGVRISKEIFDYEPPFPIAYEWIRLKGGGDMSSSKGNVLSIANMLEVVPPDVLRYLVIKYKPTRSIAFDPGLPLLQIADELEDEEARNRVPRAAELSRAAGFEPLGVPYKHLVVVAQAARFDIDDARRILARAEGAEAPAPERLSERFDYLRRWLDAFAPDDLKFEVQETLPAEASELSETQRAFLKGLADGLKEDMNGEAVHALIYEVKEGLEGAKPAELFQAVYLSLLGKVRGPRAGWFIALLGPEFCARRFAEAAA